MKPRVITILLILLAAVTAVAAQDIPRVEADAPGCQRLPDFSGVTVPQIPTSAPTPAGERVRPIKRSAEEMWWWNQLRRGTLSMQDTAVIYPKFLKFCVNVYNWADKFFNSYNPDYVVGTGKRWKARVVSDNWVDSYIVNLPEGLRVNMLSNPYSNLGAFVQYMAVSVGHTMDVNNIFGGNPLSHKKWEFGFNCALFNAEVYYQENTGGTFLRRFGKYKNGHFFKEEFPGVELHNFGAELCYFINHDKYSQGAAYNFSKFQKRSHGSFITGFAFTNLRLTMDFLQLPENLMPYLTIPAESYLLHYDSYGAILGYGYNCVISKKLLYNITVMPSFGAAHCYEDSLDGNKWFFAMNISAKTSFTYNLGNWFFSLIGKLNGHFYRNGLFSLFSSVENFSANVGIRF